MTTLPRVILKKGREKPMLRRHPWVFSGAVAKIEGDVSPGELGEVYSGEGRLLGLGHVNPRSQIIVRILAHKKEELGNDFFKKRISRADYFRDRIRKKTNAYRVINGEGDYLPGLIVDRYGEILVIQCSTAGMDRSKGILTNLLVKEFQPRNIYERSDVALRKAEGLVESGGFLYGEALSEPLEIQEYGCRFTVDVYKGQKTGFYLDQRENRFLLQGISEGKKILDCFCYTGGFSIHAAVGDAKELTLVDSSQESLAIAEEHFSLNRLEKIPHQLIRGDVFDILRGLEPGYDIVVLDPAPFAKKKGDLPRASRGYKDLNLRAFRLLNEGGLLLTFSCSHHMNWDLFQKIVFSAALDSEKKIQTVSRLGHPWDHPVDICHPEGEYLRGLICRVM